MSFRLTETKHQIYGFIGLVLFFLILIAICNIVKAEKVEVKPTGDMLSDFARVRIDLIEGDPMMATYSVRVNDLPPDTFAVYVGFLLQSRGSAVGLGRNADSTLYFEFLLPKSVVGKIK